jgi:hypothetical protein
MLSVTVVVVAIQQEFNSAGRTSQEAYVPKQKNAAEAAFP